MRAGVKGWQGMLTASIVPTGGVVGVLNTTNTANTAQYGPIRADTRRYASIRVNTRVSTCTAVGGDDIGGRTRCGACNAHARLRVLWYLAMLVQLAVVAMLVVTGTVTVTPATVATYDRTERAALKRMAWMNDTGSGNGGTRRARRVGYEPVVVSSVAMTVRRHRRRRCVTLAYAARGR